MNYLSAVKELVNNPLAIAIEFKAASSNQTKRIELVPRKYAPANEKICMFVYADRPSTAVTAANPEFLLREDFTVIYKARFDLYTTLAAGMFSKAIEDVTKEERHKAKLEMHKANYGFASTVSIETEANIDQYIFDKCGAAPVVKKPSKFLQIELRLARLISSIGCSKDRTRAVQLAREAKDAILAILEN